jgi:hypothetical protein
MPVLDRLPRLAELALGGARRAASAGASAARVIADDVRRRRQAQDSAPAEPAAPPDAPPTAPSDLPSAPEAAAAASAAPTPSAAAPAPDAPAEPAESTPPDEATPAAATAPQGPPSPLLGEPAPDHVDREAVVVAESADAGATGAVGAQITIDEPWDGYDELGAEQVVERLRDASSGMLAVVRLYEQAHGDRRTVLGAIDRRLAAISE